MRSFPGDFVTEKAIFTIAARAAARMPMVNRMQTGSSGKSASGQHGRAHT